MLLIPGLATLDGMVEVHGPVAAGLVTAYSHSA
jgi:hypothetical protein